MEHVTCLGCGCACDDIAVAVRDGYIVEARHACPLGAAWFGDGRVPAEARMDGAPCTMDAALDAAAATLTSARRALVYLALDISCETQRAAVAIADVLQGCVDGVSSSTVAGGILAAQRRGRVGATLGEIRNRADCIVFWGTDPATRYPRYTSRYAPDPAGLFVPNGRRGRVVVAVDIGASRGPADADTRLAIAADVELDVIAALRATLAGHSAAGGARDPRAAELARVLAAAHYAVIVYDAEPGAAQPASPLGRSEALTALGQQLNATIRAAITPLRGGGNRLGAEAVLAWQTGFPMTVDFSRGYPRYRPDDNAPDLVRSGAVDAVLVIGAAPAGDGALPAGDARRIVIGPRASSALPAPHIAIDTGVAGIHESGLAFRMDDIPLALRAPLPGPPVAADVVRSLGARVRAQRTAHA
jgi:formylmethanofuran dehydrogenase subunit B